MTYIMLTDDMRLVVTKADTIYRGDNLSKKITFLLPAKSENFDMMKTSVFLSYIRADGSPDIVILNRDPEMYDENHYKYILPVTCKLSKYPGEVRMWLQLFSGYAANPETAKSGDCKIHILNTDNLDGCLDDHQITALYQLKVKYDEITGGSGGSDDNETPDDGGSVPPSNSEEGFPAVEF